MRTETCGSESEAINRRVAAAEKLGFLMGNHGRRRKGMGEGAGGGGGGGEEEEKGMRVLCWCAVCGCF